jgi:putative FmdB family regulatory protein
MPLYEYKCNSCGDVFEVLQKFSDTPLTVHTKCGGTVERLISPSALHFKGTGWYVTDYGRSSKNTGGQTGSNGKSETKDKDHDKSSEKKPDVAPPAATSKSEKPTAPTP